MIQTNNKIAWLIGAVAMFPLSLQAQQQHNCVVTDSKDPLSDKTQTAAKSITNDGHPGAVYVEADTGTVRKKGVSELEGDVIIQRDEQRLNAGKASYDRLSGQVKASGNVVLSDGLNDFRSDEVDYNLDSGSGKIKGAEYRVKGSHTHGSSKEVVVKNRNEVQLKDSTYTTCPAPDPSWHIASSDIYLNQLEQWGAAKNVTLKLGNTPILYLPWLSFSMNNERKSGFLTPRVGRTDQSGYELTLPYYFNLAPNYDAQVALSVLSLRGLRIDTQVRFLTENSKGQLEYSFLPSDSQRNDEWRDHVKLNYALKTSGAGSFKVRYENVSDDDFLDDLGTSLRTSSTSALDRELRYETSGKNWTFSATALDYQILDTSFNSYAKLPELKYQYKLPAGQQRNYELTLNTEATWFERDTGATGLRADIDAKASRRFGDQSWYFKPSVGYRHSEYWLKNNPAGDRQSRSLPTLSLDGGVYLDRFLDNGYKHTLEPRLFYTYTPYEDQSGIPIFDTALKGGNTSNELFRENRFTGKDRIGDTNQLTLALTTRLQNTRTGQERIKASVGQVFYFDDRQVTLPGGTAITSRNSEIALNIDAQVNDRLKLDATTYWDPVIDDWSTTVANIHYRDKKKRLFNLGYQWSNGSTEEAEGSFVFPINSKWSVLGSTDYDLKNSRTLELLAGIEYGDCCLSSRFVTRRYLTSDNVSYDDAIFFEVEFNGLGHIGKGATRTLREKIYGYEN